MRILLALLVLSVSSVAFAEGDPPPPDVDHAPAPAPVLPERAAPLDEEEGELSSGSASSPGPCWAPIAAGAIPCLAADALGGALLGLGCIFFNATADGPNDTCCATCVNAMITAGFVALGIVFGAAALIVLGPVAALAVTIAATVGSAVAGRAFWGAAVGGVPGILVGIGGIALAWIGLQDIGFGPNGPNPALFSGELSSTLLVAGVGMAASAGLLALVGAFVGDLAFTSLLSEEEPPKPRQVSRPPPRELPLAFAEPASSAVAY